MVKRYFFTLGLLAIALQSHDIQAFFPAGLAATRDRALKRDYAAEARGEQIADLRAKYNNVPELSWSLNQACKSTSAWDELVERYAGDGRFFVIKVLLGEFPDFTTSKLDVTCWFIYEKDNKQQPNPELGETALHFAVRGGDFIFVQLLLKNKAFLDVTERTGKTSLHLAVERKWPDIVRALLLAGASVDPKDRDVQIPLAFLLLKDCKSCNSKCKEILKILLEYSCDVNSLKQTLMEMGKDKKSHSMNHHTLRVMVLFQSLGRHIDKKNRFFNLI